MTIQYGINVKFTLLANCSAGGSLLLPLQHNSQMLMHYVCFELWATLMDPSLLTSEPYCVHMPWGIYLMHSGPKAFSDFQTSRSILKSIRFYSRTRHWSMWSRETDQRCSPSRSCVGISTINENIHPFSTVELRPISGDLGANRKTPDLSPATYRTTLECSMNLTFSECAQVRKGKLQLERPEPRFEPLTVRCPNRIVQKVFIQTSEKRCVITAHTQEEKVFLLVEKVGK